MEAVEGNKDLDNKISKMFFNKNNLYVDIAPNYSTEDECALIILKQLQRLGRFPKLITLGSNEIQCCLSFPSVTVSTPTIALSVCLAAVKSYEKEEN